MNLRISIGTENRAKVLAVKNVFNRLYNLKRDDLSLFKNYSDLKFYSKKVESGVREQPQSDEEGILGAMNRAKNVYSLVESDLAIGLEGSIQDTSYGMFLTGWVVIYDGSSFGIGSGPKILLPEFMAKELRNGKELGPLVQEMENDSNNEIRHSLGTGGLLTAGMFTRIQEFEESILAAMAKFLTPKYYSKK